jgi:hypothetical protein
MALRWQPDAPRQALRCAEPATSATDDDIDALLVLRMSQDIELVADRLDRLLRYGWIRADGDDYPELTAAGVDLLRRWLS